MARRRAHHGDIIHTGAGRAEACPYHGEVVTMVEIIRLFVVSLLLVTVMVIIKG